jgi:bifunctional UDP-N-acetylglucosamine pyrophosphorylase/glucosamine-1-phosphate N-acetyltransferase
MLEWVVRTVHQAGVEEIIIVGSKALFAHEMWSGFVGTVAEFVGKRPLSPPLESFEEGCETPGAQGKIPAKSGAVWEGSLCPKTDCEELRKMPRIRFVEQDEPRGTGHAVQVALPYVDERAEGVLICNGDTPFINKETLQRLVAQGQDGQEGRKGGGGVALLAMRIGNPEQATYGRVVLSQNSPVDIVEARDASPAQKKIDLANVGGYYFQKQCLAGVIPLLSPQNRAGELYLTDTIKLAHEKGYRTTYIETSEREGEGIDTPAALQNARFAEVLVARALAEGASFQDPHSAILFCDTQVGRGCSIGAYNVFGRNVVLEEGVTVLPFCFLEDCVIKKGSTIGPFARIKGGSVVGAEAVVGNFVEVKKSTIGDGTKIKHLTYVGDADIGSAVNVGAGAVFCNYDGFRKHPTVVEDHAKIGANVSLVAPVTIGQAAFVGAGSVITKDVPKETLAIARAGQVHNAQWLAKKRGSSGGSS